CTENHQGNSFFLLRIILYVNALIERVRIKTYGACGLCLIRLCDRRRPLVVIPECCRYAVYRNRISEYTCFDHNAVRIFMENRIYLHAGIKDMLIAIRRYMRDDPVFFTLYDFISDHRTLPVIPDKYRLG